MVAPFSHLLPSHAFDKNWPVHARFHLVWAAGKLFAIGVGQLLLLIFAFHAGQQWSWFAVASNLFFGGLFLIPASRLQHGPIAAFDKHDRSTKLFVVCLSSGVLGLALAFGPMFLQ